MPRQNDPDDVVKVGEVAQPRGAQVRKVQNRILVARHNKTAFPSAGSVSSGSGGNFYSPELSTDFLELPQSVDEQRNFYRFFYDYEPFVGQAIDLNTELPLSKVRIGMPEARDRKLAERAMRFCARWVKHVKLLQRLMEITHEWYLIGEVFIFVEDTNPEMPREVREQAIREISADGEITEKWEAYPDADERAVKWLNQNYKGWTAIRCLPPEQVRVESFPFTDERLIELVIDTKTKAIINQAQQGDPRAIKIANSMPLDVIAAVEEGRNVPLNTDPDAGSFVYFLARKRSPYEPHGKSILGRCLLPGTPIWINREGLIQQVPVEEVNDQDLLLTHKGRFLPCKTGSRSVDETVVALTIDGIEEPLRLTAEHKVLRVQEDGTEDWVEAGKLVEGDLVREAHVVPEGKPLEQINLAQWWSGKTVTVAKRGRKKLGLAQTDRILQVVEAKEQNSQIQVTFEYQEDDRNRQLSENGLSKLLAWAHALTEPVIKTQTEVAVEAGITLRDVRVYAPRLRNEGLIKTERKSLGRGRGFQVLWHPAMAKELPKVQFTVTSPITQIQITEDFCYLLGTWLGDGCLWTDHESRLNVHSVGWSLHDPEVEQRVVGLVNSCFGNPVTERGSLIGTSIRKAQDLRIEDRLLTYWFRAEFGHTAQGKHLPEWVFNLPEEHLLALLRGLLDTDGWLSKEKSRIEITLDNKILIDQIHLICNRVGIKTQVKFSYKAGHTWVRRWETSKGWVEKTYEYDGKRFAFLSCSRSEDVRHWAECSIKGGSNWTTRNIETRGCPKAIDGWIIRRIGYIGHCHYTGPVYSFGVDGDTSHTGGRIVVSNCLRTLLLRDKIRQALQSIASRHMTPMRLIYGLNMSDSDTEALREQVDLALQDPDYSIVTNFEVTWNEMGADQRLPDWSWVYELTDRQLYAGLGVTESLLSGETSYSGDRIHLEVINTRFMLLREMLQDLVEDFFFKPMCARMGFVEEDEDGVLQPIVPKLSFTRLALRDTQDTFDAMLNLYQKGSIPIEVMLDLLNIDPVSAQEGLQQDLFTLNDSSMNEALRGAYGDVGRALAENSDITDKVAQNLGLSYKKPPAEGRFG